MYIDHFLVRNGEINEMLEAANVCKNYEEYVIITMANQIKISDIFTVSYFLDETTSFIQYIQ